MAFRNVVDFSDGHDTPVRLRRQPIDTDPLESFSEDFEAALCVAEHPKREQRFKDVSDLEYDYLTLIKTDTTVFSNPDPQFGYFAPANPRTDPEVLANIGNERKIHELHIRTEFQKLRRRKLEQLNHEINDSIDRLLAKKRATVREMVNARLEENYNRISLDVIDVDYVLHM